ncbi:hypothetical protein DEO72_LG6g2004 [Vigna unguiculata]|uniref:Uncharacterized protein n=1 Tax=Vigna unguiculata TaxID=3917 RepID=A0A4D6MBZ9_VIGUN|nr:hypothetical protein DEO72_LG6g2004 [Vigna unguiculata]
MAAPSLSNSAVTTASAWSDPSTIFAPLDASLYTCFSCSFSNLLRHCIIVTSDSINRKTGMTASAKVFIERGEITQPDLFNNGMMVIHGLQGLLNSEFIQGSELAGPKTLLLKTLPNVRASGFEGKANPFFWPMANLRIWIPHSITCANPDSPISFPWFVK